ncbi:MAG: protein translocase subunit SecF [Micromonosporaceae bacterium]
MGLLSRLYRGETEFDFIGSRKRWYIGSLVILAVCIGSLAIQGFNFGIEFSGGNQFVIKKAQGVELEEARTAVEDLGIEVASAQQVGTGARSSFVIKTGELSESQLERVEEDLAKSLDVPAQDISHSEVSESWGDSITRQALIGLVVFLIAVSAYLWFRFEQKMALAAMLALVHDLVMTAGIYSLIGFEVTPSTVIGMLTILGYSLYDTVVVFDKVQENTRGLLGTTRYTYGEAANLAVNQTLMRSINTSLIGLLPVAGLLFVGAGMLGVGTLKDLALVLFVGMASGAYSSLFIATPMLVDFKRAEPRYQAQEKRVLAKRAGEDTGAKAARRQAKRAEAAKAKASAKSSTRAAGDEDVDELEDEYLDETDEYDEEDVDAEEYDEDEDEDRELAGLAPRPGARPSSSRTRKRTGGRSTRTGRSGRSGGKRRRG